MESYKIFLIIALSSYASVMVLGSCPPGFFHHGESCYVILNVSSTWADAMQLCEIFGAGLTVVETQQEDMFIKGMLHKLSASIHEKEVWLGGTDMLNEGEWLWAKTFQQISYARWAPNEPNNGLSGMNQHCLGMERDNDFKWDDFFCTKMATPFCERPFFTESGTEIIG